VFSLKDSRGVILDPFADHHFSANVHEVEHPADRIAGRCVGLLLFAASDPRQGVQSGCLSCPQEIDLDDAFVVFVRLLMRAHRRTKIANSQQ
jgi:hypothetical protein